MTMNESHIKLVFSLILAIGFSKAAINNVCHVGSCSRDQLCVPAEKECSRKGEVCEQFACIDNITNNICGSHVCPADHQCVEDRNCAGGSANCPKYWCYDRSKMCFPDCANHELCVRTNYGRYVCVPQMNEVNALYDGRPEGDFVACVEHRDCYDYREATKWGCCMLRSIHAWSDRGCYCDKRIGSCAMERREFSWMRWSFCIPTNHFRCEGVKCEYT